MPADQDATTAASRANFEGAVLMSASVAGYVFNDALMKTLAGELALPQALFIRGLAASLLLGLLAAHRHAFRWRADRRNARLIGLRTGAEIVGTLCFLTALFNMPIANATAITLLAPLIATLGAAVFPRETVGWRRYVAILAGFVGVMLIVQPGTAGFNAYALLALAGAGCIAAVDLLARAMTQAAPSVVVALATAIGITLTGAVLTPLTGWTPLSALVLLTLMAAAGFLVVGYLCGVMAVRGADIGFVAPFRYTVLLWALGLGVVVFGEFPEPLALAGGLLVAATGLYTWHRERRLGRATLC